MTGFAHLHNQFPQFRADYTPPWGLPVAADFQRIQAVRGLRYPAPFIEFQTVWARRLPSFPQGFRWANPGLEAYASLDSLIDDVQALGLIGFAPFADDNGDVIGFLVEHAQHAAPAAVARYEHAQSMFHIEAEGVIDWLRGHYRRHVAAHGPPCMDDARMIGRDAEQ